MFVIQIELFKANLQDATHEKLFHITNLHVIFCMKTCFFYRSSKDKQTVRFLVMSFKLFYCATLVFK